MKLILSVTNKNFETAFALVARDYSDMFHHSLEYIKLCKKSEHVWSHNLGIHKRISKPICWKCQASKQLESGLCTKCGMFGTNFDENSKTCSQIFICNGRNSVCDFIETLVHELTHLQQHVKMESGGVKMSRNEMEDEAYPAGRAARLLYEGKF